MNSPGSATPWRARDELVARFEEAGHPFPRLVVALATGGSAQRCEEMLAEIDTLGGVAWIATRSGLRPRPQGAINVASKDSGA